MRYIKPGRLYCFSPPVMLATFIVEVLLALYVLVKYRLTPVTRLAVFVLIGLAVFQLAEFNVCQGAWGLDGLDWARLGYVAITLLPPLGLHLAVRIAGESRRLLVGSAYGLAVFFTFIFLFVGQGVQSEACLGNYAIFKIAPWAAWPYTLYYFGLLAVTIAYAWHAAAASRKKSVRGALYALALGYVAFILPTTIVAVSSPETIAGIPSIMCGFAVILALILVFIVLPRYAKGQKGFFSRTKAAIIKIWKK